MRLSTYVYGVPAVLILGGLSVANRQDVRFSLDPFSQSHPALSFDAPLYALLFLFFLLGVLLGGLVTMLGRLLRAWAAKPANPLPPPGPGPKTRP